MITVRVNNNYTKIIYNRLLLAVLAITIYKNNKNNY